MKTKITLALLLLSACGGLDHKLDESRIAAQQADKMAASNPSPAAGASIQAGKEYVASLSQEELQLSTWEDITRLEGLKVWKNGPKTVRIAQESALEANSTQQYDVWLKGGKPVQLSHVSKLGNESKKDWYFSPEGKCYDGSTFLEADAVAALIASPYPNYIIALREQELDAFKKGQASFKAGSQLGAKAYSKPGYSGTWLVWNTQTEEGPRTVYARSEGNKIDFWKIEGPQGHKYALRVFQYAFFGEWQEAEGSKTFYLDLAENMGQMEFLQAHGY